MAEPDFVAPASKPLTELHIRDRSRGMLLEAPGQAATIGMTICGDAMYTKDAWQLLNREPGDRVCATCEAGYVGERKWGWR